MRKARVGARAYTRTRTREPALSRRWRARESSTCKRGAGFTLIHPSPPFRSHLPRPARHRERQAGQDGDGRGGQAVHVRRVHERRHPPGDAHGPGAEYNVLLSSGRGQRGVHRALLCVVARRRRNVPVHLCRHRRPWADRILRRHASARERELLRQFCIPDGRRQLR